MKADEPSPFLLKCKQVRVFLVSRPGGSTYREILAELRDVGRALSWLESRGYAQKSGGGKEGPTIWKARSL